MFGDLKVSPISRRLLEKYTHTHPNAPNVWILYLHQWGEKRPQEQREMYVGYGKHSLFGASGILYFLTLFNHLVSYHQLSFSAATRLVERVRSFLVRNLEDLLQGCHYKPVLGGRLMQLNKSSILKQIYRFDPVKRFQNNKLFIAICTI